MNKYGKLQFTLFKPQSKQQIEQKVMVLSMSNSCQCIDCGQTTDIEIFVEFLMFLEAFEDAITSDLLQTITDQLQTIISVFKKQLRFGRRYWERREGHLRQKER